MKVMVMVKATPGSEAGTMPSEEMMLEMGRFNEELVAAERIFKALAEGGNINMPLGSTFWLPCYGQVSDKFGVEWMVMVPMETK